MVLAARTHPELVPGERVCDDYVIEGFARGGDGPEVYAARHVASDVARFTVRVVPCRDFPTSTRFLRGMARARRVEHRALAPVVAFEVRDVGAITVQREVAAETLRARGLVPDGFVMPEPADAALLSPVPVPPQVRDFSVFLAASEAVTSSTSFSSDRCGGLKKPRSS